MLNVEELASLSSEEYLEHFQIEFYLGDLASTLGGLNRSTRDKVVGLANDDRGNAPECICRYFDALLRGEHVVGREFEYINQTPLNRRAFVKHLRCGLRNVTGPGRTAVTAHDFHDLAVQLCPGFPLRIVELAASFAEEADPSKHHFLAEARPFSASASRNASALGSGAGSTAAENAATPSRSPVQAALLVFASLLRLVEFCFVYSEFLSLAQDVFSAARRMGDSDDASVSLPRHRFVEDLRARIRSREDSALWLPAGAALPSDRALLRLLRPVSNTVAGPSAIASELITCRGAVVEMAEHFELELAPLPDGFFGRGPESGHGDVGSKGSIRLLGQIMLAVGVGNQQVLGMHTSRERQLRCP